MEDNRLIGVASTDILYDAEALKKDVDDFRKVATQADVTLVLKGQITEEVRNVFIQASIPIIEFKVSQHDQAAAAARYRN